MIPFPLNKNRFSFFVAGHLLVGHLSTNPKSDRSLLSCLKVTQCSKREIGDAPLNNSCTLPIQVMTARTIAGLQRITGTWPGWWKQSFRLRLPSLVWFQVRATSCHLTSSKSAWKSTPKCTWMCWRVWWSPGAIRWSVADPGCGSRTRHRPISLKRLRLGFRSSAATSYPFLTGPPPPPTWTRWTTSFGHTLRTSPTWPPTTPKKTKRERSTWTFLEKLERCVTWGWLWY